MRRIRLAALQDCEGLIAVISSWRAEHLPDLEQIRITTSDALRLARSHAVDSMTSRLAEVGVAVYVEAKDGLRQFGSSQGVL